MLAGLFCLVLIPAAEAGTVKPKSNCKNACSSSYSLCMKRSNTGRAKKACKAQKKTCKKSCKT